MTVKILLLKSGEDVIADVKEMVSPDKKVTFEDGLLSINLGKVVPEHHARKDYL